jgi:SAM-dependent methyltransferase
VREQTAEILRCPVCGAERSLRLSTRLRDEREVREGELSCARCAGRFPVRGGVIDLLPDPPEFVRRERAGLERFAAVMRADGWDEQRVLALPDVELPYWHGQRRALEELLERAAPAPGARLLDVGANTCWASRIFAERGLRVVALDIAPGELQGLATADYSIGRGGAFFERVLSVMFAPALATGSFDYVFCCEVLHHNDRAHLRRTFRELWRLLRPGGTLFVVNEPMRFPLRPKLHHGREVAQFEGNEHVYPLYAYWRAARAAGFSVALPALARARAQARAGEGPRALARWAWRNVLRGDVPLAMDCARPA